MTPQLLFADILETVGNAMSNIWVLGGLILALIGLIVLLVILRKKGAE
jgi:hypothetical protein